MLESTIIDFSFLIRRLVSINKSQTNLELFKFKQTHISFENPTRATCFATTPVK